MLDILIFIMVVVAVIVGLRLATAQQRKLEKRIKAMQTRGRGKSTTFADLSLKRKTEKTNSLFSLLAKPLPSFEKLGERLERADIKLSPKQYALRRILWVLAFMILFSIILRLNIAIAFVIGFVLGVWVPLKWMQRGINKRNKAFLKLFPDAIDLIVRGLRSGLPVSESIVLVSTEVPQPVGGIFMTLNNTMKLGVTLEKALQEMARKLDLTEFNFFCTSIILQRETGGNLSEILNNLSEVLRGRFIMGMKIKAMSSEARASAMIIGFLPFFVIGAVSIMTPSYLRPMIDDYRGNIAAAVATGMMLFGGWVMNRMTKFEI